MKSFGKAKSSGNEQGEKQVTQGMGSQRGSPEAKRPKLVSRRRRHVRKVSLPGGTFDRNKGYLSSGWLLDFSCNSITVRSNCFTRSFRRGMPFNPACNLAASMWGIAG